MSEGGLGLIFSLFISLFTLQFKLNADMIREKQFALKAFVVRMRRKNHTYTHAHTHKLFIETQTGIHVSHMKEQRTHAVIKLNPFILHVLGQIFAGVCGHRYKSSAKSHVLKEFI